MVWWRALLVPSLGGIGVGLAGWLVARYHPRRAIDPIEANALYGGRMSLNDSLIVVGQTMLSNGVGASVGLEAGYTQVGAAIASRLGRSFRLRRSDLRLIVGCGAAAAIGGAFNAPLTGAFYAFELVIGTYSLANLAPVMAASLAAVAVGRLLDPEPYTFEVQVPSLIPAADYLPLVALGIVCALCGVALMRGVTLTEGLFRRSRMPVWLRPGIGGLAVGAMALLSPQVLSSGHAGMQVSLDAPYALRPHRPVDRAQGRGFCSVAGIRVPRRIVLRQPVLGFAGRKILCRRTGAGGRRLQRPPHRLRAGRHEFAGGRRGGGAAHHGVSGVGEHRLPAAHRRGGCRQRHLVDHGAAHLRLLLRDLALPPARRGDPQRRRCGLGAQPDGGSDDA